MSNAFVIIHFGNNIKYLELEIYFAINLRDMTKHDIIYMYSINDTPKSFVRIMKKYVTKTIPYDDTNIIYNIKEIPYRGFNALRTCNYIFAYTLHDYEKICIIESDIIIKANIDSIFDLNVPAAIYYESNPFTNEKIIPKILGKGSLLNGGVLVIHPSIKLFNKSIQNIPKILDYEYPNEALFALTNKSNFYTLPFRYNGVSSIVDKSKQVHKILQKYKFTLKNIDCFHFSGNIYKYLDYIRDGFYNKYPNKLILTYFLNFFKQKYYDKYNVEITKVLQSVNNVNNNSKINSKINVMI